MQSHISKRKSVRRNWARKLGIDANQLCWKDGQLMRQESYGTQGVMLYPVSGAPVIKKPAKTGLLPSR